MSSPNFNPETSSAPRGAPSTLPATTELGGREVVVAYSDVAAEFAALRKSAIVVDRSFRGRMRFFGEKSGEALTGLVTSDVVGTGPGHGHYAAALSAKGRIVADLRIFATPVGSSYLVDTSPRAWPGFLAMVRKYVNPRLSGYRDDSHAIRDVGIFGADARRIVSRLTGVAADALGALAPFDNVTATMHGTEVLVARVPDLGEGLEGFDLFVPFETFGAAWRDAIAAGGTPAGLAAWEIARVEAGRPEWGIDIDENTIPQEANFDELDAISYTKGCYIGQEVVARVHFRGHVNRHLRGLRSVGAPPPTGAQLIDDTGNHVGDVRSAVSSPRLGGIAIGMVRREVSPGASLTARSEHGEQRVDVAALPFSA
jgi:folate-binding protein YgfZ